MEECVDLGAGREVIDVLVVADRHRSCGDGVGRPCACRCMRMFANNSSGLAVMHMCVAAWLKKIASTRFFLW